MMEGPRVARCYGTLFGKGSTLCNADWGLTVHSSLVRAMLITFTNIWLWHVFNSSSSSSQLLRFPLLCRMVSGRNSKSSVYYAQYSVTNESCSSLVFSKIFLSVYYINKTMIIIFTFTYFQYLIIAYGWCRDSIEWWLQKRFLSFNGRANVMRLYGNNYETTWKWHYLNNSTTNGE